MSDKPLFTRSEQLHSGGHPCASIPCATCPWRVDQDATVIPGFNLEKARGLLNTVGDEDGFRPIMACHGSPEGQERICLGYLARAGYTNINVRILLADNMALRPDTVLNQCKTLGIRLHRTYAAVLRKLQRTA